MKPKFANNKEEAIKQFLKENHKHKNRENRKICDSFKILLPQTIIFLIFFFCCYASYQGHSLAPILAFPLFSVFYGWLMLPAYLLGIFYIPFIPLIFCFLSFYTMNSIWKGRINKQKLRKIMIKHFIGSFIATLICMAFFISLSDEDFVVDWLGCAIIIFIIAILNYVVWGTFFEAVKRKIKTIED